MALAMNFLPLSASSDSASFDLLLVDPSRSPSSRLLQICLGRLGVPVKHLEDLEDVRAALALSTPAAIVTTISLAHLEVCPSQPLVTSTGKRIPYFLILDRSTESPPAQEGVFFIRKPYDPASFSRQLMDMCMQSHDPTPSFSSPAIDPQVLEDLERLGGIEFVNEIKTQFVTDADVLMAEIVTAVQLQDVRAFQDRVHALRSCAANVGARSLYQLCLQWREISATELETKGEAHLSQLVSEVALVRKALKET